MFEAKVECPRCRRIWIIQQGQPGVECDCHLYCEDGNSVRDCSLKDPDNATDAASIAADGGYVWNKQHGYPAGMHTENSDDDDVPNRNKYCTTHHRWSYKDMIFLEVDWDKWNQTSRLPKKYREQTM